MRIHNENAEGRSLSTRLLGLSVAALTTVAAFLVAAPGAHAAPDTISADDEFSTAINPVANHNNKVTLTKYLANAAGTAATGSSLDARPGSTPGQGVVFKLQEITPSGTHTPGEMSAHPLGTNYDAVSGKTWYGVTDVNGQIINRNSDGEAGAHHDIGIWMKEPSGGTLPGNADEWAKWAKGTNPTGVGVTNPIANAQDSDVVPLESNGMHYYELSEVAHPDNLSRYSVAEATIFSLPYMTSGLMTDGGGQHRVTGYIHHLHIFPKNVSNQQISKTISEYDGHSYTPGNDIAQVGKDVTWKITQSINTGTAQPNNNNVYWSHVHDTAVTGEYLKVVDRVSSALEVDPTVSGNVTVEFVYTDASNSEQTHALGPDDVNVDSSYTTTAPKSLDNSRNMFASDGQSKFLIVHFKHASASYLTGLTGTVNNPHFVITVKSKISANGASDASQPGRLANSVATDTDNDDTSGQNAGQADASMPSAGFQFAKVDTHGHGLAGAEFALQKNDGSGDFLLADGTFGSGTAANPKVTATSNAQGVVTFTGIVLPVGVSRNQGEFKLIETQAPHNYQQAASAFDTVDFGNIVSQPSAAAAILANPAGLRADINSLNFGRFEATNIDSNIKDADNNHITKGMMNWADGEAGAPISLPLTGGKGIVLLLVVGLAIMGGVLVVRNRKSASVGRHI
ncbi:SpaA isopeptide-forming pilin-related protein [Bifidobacterium xylocopae]|uniref:Gram-positive cocci surface proteins LPxTG domain-containing protein n=1 Tax=Bifidobacterium xylocopae TaxID=2493119 RepID=A0A366KBP4_9BIFI|nr:SpaA isopeptide-forming pilin-related protein [Bifidobacterium xylocopae]RBP99019.1 hypothetical protein CRD59_05990 [Bifidobacterium xylocopae]